MHETGEAAQQHAATEAEGRGHVLEIGLVDRGRVIGEAAQHRDNSTRHGWKRVACFDERAVLALCLTGTVFS